MHGANSSADADGGSAIPDVSGLSMEDLLCAEDPILDNDVERFVGELGEPGNGGENSSTER